MKKQNNIRALLVRNTRENLPNCASKTSKGITLIALIITVIILLILAMVSVKLVMNSGIITKSEQAVKTYSEEETGEKIQLAYSDYQMGKLNNESDTFEQALTNAGVNYISVTGSDEEGYIVTAILSDGREKQYKVSANGVGTLKTLEDYGVQIGDYVAYNEAGTGDYTADTSKGAGRSGTYNSTTKRYDLTAGDAYTTENLGWRVLGVNAKGELELISDNPTTNSIYLANEEGYVNAESVLNEFCNTLYGKGEHATGARSLNVDDVNNLIDTGYDPKTYSGYGDIWTYRFPTNGEYMQYKRTGSTNVDWTNITSSSYQTFRMPGETNTISTDNRGDEGVSLESTFYSYTIANYIKQTTSDGTAMSDIISKGTGQVM